MSEPKFKVGDRVVHIHSNEEYEITGVKTNNTSIKYHIDQRCKHRLHGTVSEDELRLLYDWKYEEGDTLIQISECINHTVLAVKIGKHQYTTCIQPFEVHQIRHAQAHYVLEMVKTVFEEAIRARYKEDIEHTTKELCRVLGAKND